MDAMSGWDRKEAITKAFAEVDFSVSKIADAYLPSGSDWYYFWTEKKYKGGQDITFESTFDQVPMFIKAGTILPLAPVVQYAEQSKWTELEIVVYPGADGSFTLYEDEGDNYNYEKGQYMTITFNWNDSHRKLSIGSISGEYPRMPTERTFRVRPAGTDKTVKVSYSGEAVTLTL